MEQWQDELFFKFGLRFDILTGQLIDAGEGAPIAAALRRAGVPVRVRPARWTTRPVGIIAR